MPESPEIRLAADEISAAVAGYPTEGVRFTLPHLKPFEKRLSGQTVTHIETRGKAMLTHFDNDWVVYSHNQLYGRWYIVQAGEKSKTNRQLRFEISTLKKSALLYSASDIDVIKVDKLDQHPFLAGLGNYLRAEILLFAGLHPKLKPSDCSTDQLECLSQHIIAVTERAYRTRGVTNLPTLVKQLKQAGQKSKQSYRFSTYGWEGKPCCYCSDHIQRTDLGGREIYSCPSCQPEP